MQYIRLAYLFGVMFCYGITCVAQEDTPCDSFFSQSELSEEGYENFLSCLFKLNYYVSDEPRILYRRAIQKAFEEGDSVGAARIHIPLADLFYELHQNDSSQIYIERAASIFLRFEDEIGYARTANLRRLVATRENDFLKALDISFEALEIFEEYGDQKGMAIAYRDIGSVFIQEGKYDEALSYCLKSVAPLEKIEDNYELGFTYQRIAIIYKNLGQFEIAQEYIGKAISSSRKLSDFRANQALAKKVWTRGYIYEAREDLDNALLYYDSAKYYAEIVDYTLIDKWIYNYKGSIYLKRKEYSRALEEFNKAVEVGSADDGNINKYDYYLPVYDNLVASYVGLGNYKKAYELQDLISETKDSVFAIESEKLSLELQEKYQAAQREERIQSLQKDKRTQRYILILGAILLLALTALAVFYGRANKYRKRTNKLLRDQQEDIIKKSQHNELLVKEIHHRVKNNLQILSSLLSLQSDAEDNETVVHALQEGRNRVEAMGMIHQRLYKDEAMTAIDMSDYIPDLCDYLMDTLSDGNVKITSHVSVGMVDVETAIPLGLIVNELITNSIKYAFESGENGFIEVRLWIDRNDELYLQVSDNGKGAQHSLHKDTSTKFGSNLVAILSRKLKGKIFQSDSNGYVTKIVFTKFKLLSIVEEG